MRILKNYWLRASAALLTLVLGVFVYVNAMNDGKELPATVQDNLYWFKIDGTYDLTDPVQSSDASSLSPTPSPTPPPEDDCGTDNPHQCVSGFTEDQVNLATMELINDNQTPAATPRTKN